MSGCTDYFATTEQEAFEIGRATVAAFNIDLEDLDVKVEEPLFSADELLGILPTSNSENFDIYQVPPVYRVTLTICV